MWSIYKETRLRVLEGPPPKECGCLLETVILDDKLKCSIVEKIEHFMDSKEMCLQKGSPHHYEMVWHGPLGTGKTRLGLDSHATTA